MSTESVLTELASSHVGLFPPYGNPSATNQQNRAGVWDANYANHGTLTDANGNTAAVAGKAGGALDLAGDADFLNMGSAASVDDVNPRTLEFWVKREGTGVMQMAAKSGTGGYFSAEIQSAGGGNGPNTVR
jgi:hypothetical protein